MHSANTRNLAAAAWFFLSGVASGAMAADIAYLRLTDGYWQVWVTSETGEEHKQLTFDAVDKTRVSWSHDRQALLVNRSDGSLATVNRNGEGSTAIAMGEDGVLDAKWSPDSTKVAFSLNSTSLRDNNDLWQLDIASGKTRRLTARPGIEQSPSWSVDGRSLFFSSGRADTGHSIWRYDFETQSEIQLTVGPGTHFDPVASPAGVVAYASDESGNYDIWLLQDGKKRQLTANRAYDGQPSWSPDGKSLAFYSLRDGAKRIWVRRIDGSEPVAITPEAAQSRYPVWAW